MKFTVVISYENYSLEEMIQIECDNIKEAKQKCEDIKNQNKKNIINLELKNIYTSKTIKDCRLYKKNWRDEILELDFLKKEE